MDLGSIINFVMHQVFKCEFSDSVYISLQNEELLEEAYTSGNSKKVPDYSGPRRSKRSKRKRAV